MRIIAAAAAFAAALSLAAPAAAQTDAQIRQRLIRQSIAAYPGSCPCPYNTDRAGRRCGARSAYSRPRGAAPLCYPSDVTPAMLRSARGP
jgi:choline dehydrogenase-like flavoprotein